MSIRESKLVNMVKPTPLTKVDFDRALSQLLDTLQLDHPRVMDAARGNPAKVREFLERVGLFDTLEAAYYRKLEDDVAALRRVRQIVEGERGRGSYLPAWR